MKILVLITIIYCLSVSIWKFFYGSTLWIETYGVSKMMLYEHQWYRLLLGPFAHASLLHLWLNLYALYYLFWDLKYSSDSRRLYLASTFILSVPVAAISFSFFSVSGYSVGISGGVISVLGFLLVVDKSREIFHGLILIFAAGALMPNIIDNISHVTGFLLGSFFGLCYIGKLNNRALQNAGPKI
jgi:membrane associated rhomboid family serine protease